MDFYSALGIGFLNELPDITQRPPTTCGHETSMVAPNRGEHASPAPLVSKVGEQHAIAAGGSRLLTFSSRQQIFQIAPSESESAAGFKEILQEKDAQLTARTAELAEARKELKVLASTLEVEKKHLQDEVVALERKVTSVEKDISSMKESVRASSASLATAKEASDAKFVKLEQEMKQKIADEGVHWKQHYLKVAVEDRNRLSGEDAKLQDQLIVSVKTRVIREYKESVEYRRDVEAELIRHKQSPEYVKEVQVQVREGAFLWLRATVNEHKVRQTDLPLRQWKCYELYFLWEDELKRQGSPLALKETETTVQPTRVGSDSKRRET